jgi:hypothetical protein
LAVGIGPVSRGEPGGGPCRAGGWRKLPTGRSDSRNGGGELPIAGRLALGGGVASSCWGAAAAGSGATKSTGGLEGTGGFGGGSGSGSAEAGSKADSSGPVQPNSFRNASSRSVTAFLLRISCDGPFQVSTTARRDPLDATAVGRRRATSKLDPNGRQCAVRRLPRRVGVNDEGALRGRRTRVAGIAQSTFCGSRHRVGLIICVRYRDGPTGMKNPSAGIKTSSLQYRRHC